MNSPVSTVVFIEIGRYPDWLVYAIRQVRAFSNVARIILATDQPVQGHRQFDELNVEVMPVSVDDYKKSVSGEFKRKYKKVFWENCSLRFFILRDVIEKNHLKHVLHLESDYMIYLSPEEIVRTVDESVSLGLCAEKDRVIPGLVYIKDSKAADVLAQAIAKGIAGSKNDMEAIYTLLSDRCSGVHLFRTQEWLNGVNEFGTPFIELEGVVFDAACLGMYLLGEHKNPLVPYSPKNSTLGRGDLVYFLNPMLSRHPVYQSGDKIYKIAGLHIHSKKLNCVASYSATYVPFSGDRLFDFCDVVIASVDRLPYLQSIGIGGDKVRYIDDFYLPSNGDVVGIFSDQLSIFPVEYLNLLKVKRSAVYIVHNSDENNSPEVVCNLLGPNNLVYVQNLTSVQAALPVLPLPIGLQNRKWPGVSSKNWQIASKRKYWSFLSALSKTHRSRLLPALVGVLMARRLSHLEKKSEIKLHNAFEIFRRVLRKMNPQYVTGYKFSSAHWVRLITRSFFVYSPRGNGLDTHRFWEAQLFGSIPVVPERDYIPAYAGYPVVVGNFSRHLLNPVSQRAITQAMSNRDIEKIISINDFEVRVKQISERMVSI